MTRCTECITLRLDQSSSCIAFPPTCNNYATARNFFPDVLKENTVVPVYKKANMSGPNNHRGIVLANTLQIIASSWLLHKFQSYVGDMGLSLRRRGAAQRGAQISDMTHLLHSIDSFAKIRIATSYRHIRSSRG